MTSIGSPSPFFLAGKKAYEVERSLRFNDDDSAYLNRTPSSTGNRKTFTFSFWVKRANLGMTTTIFAMRIDAANQFAIRFISGTDILQIIDIQSSTVHISLDSSAVFRDVSAWYHIVVALDTTQSTNTDRFKLYVNGSQVTSFSTSTYPSQNHDTLVNTTNAHYIGKRPLPGNEQFFDGYLAEFNFIDGFQYDPSYFGQTDAITGQWNPKKYTGSYGTNGFYLNFSDNSGTTATTLGKDSSGNGNNFTPNNFVTGDAVKDSPTNNFSVFRHHGTPPSSGSSIAEGNLRFTTGSSGSARNLNRMGISTFLPTSGKWYAEVRVTGGGNNNFVGVAPYQVGISPTSNNTRYVYYYGPQGQIYQRTAGSESNANYGASFGNDDIIGIYINMDAGTPIVYFSKNGQWADGSGNSDESTPTSGITLGDTFFTTDTGGHTGIGISVCSSASSDSTSYQVNFGQDSTFSGLTTAGGNTDANGKGDFKYTVPANALAMCSANLPDPTILLPNKHFDTILYTGSGNPNHNITGSDTQFKPDWVWIKARTQAYTHLLYDSVRGVGNQIYSNSTDAEYANLNNIYSFNDNGFSLGLTSNDDVTNKAGDNFAAWSWNAGNTDGKTYTVKVVSDSGNKYRFDNFGTSAVTLDLAEGGTYIFNMDDASNASHPFSIGTAANGTVYTSGITYFLDGVSKTYSQYTSGFAAASTRRLHITVPASAPVLYYWCSVHSGMGGQINTNSTLGSSNFDGSIQSTVKVNASAGFSIVAFTSDGTSLTAGHGLGVSPDVIIKKQRNASGDWYVYHKSIGATETVKLNETSAKSNSSDFGNTSPTSSVFSSNTTGVSGRQIIAYCFSEVAGYSKFGSYTGNGNASGTFVFLGFRPAWLIIKRTDSAENWILKDTARNTFNDVFSNLNPNTSNAEFGSSGDVNSFDFVSNGFKIRGSNSAVNASGGTFIYLAFAEAPFKNARAR